MDHEKSLKALNLDENTFYKQGVKRIRKSTDDTDELVTCCNIRSSFFSIHPDNLDGKLRKVELVNEFLLGLLVHLKMSKLLLPMLKLFTKT